MSLWDQVKTNMAEWYAIAADKTGEMARLGVRKYDQFALSREIERSFQDLGGRVYELIRSDQGAVASDDLVQKLCERIRGLEEQFAAKEREIQAIRERGRQPSGPIPSAREAAFSTPASPAESGDEGDLAGDFEDISTAVDGEDDSEWGPDRELEARERIASEEPWDEEIAVWHQPLEVDEDPDATNGGRR